MTTILQQQQALNMPAIFCCILGILMIIKK